jgi:hypothetical protein
VRVGNNISGVNTEFLYSSLALTTTQLTVHTSAGTLLVPKTGVITLDGREAKFLVTDYVFGQTKAKLLYSTAE